MYQTFFRATNCGKRKSSKTNAQLNQSSSSRCDIEEDNTPTKRTCDISNEPPNTMIHENSGMTSPSQTVGQVNTRPSSSYKV